MHRDYIRKVVVITGATGGIGKKVAEMLTNEGHKVYSLSRKYNPDPKIKFIQCDVTSEEQVEMALQQIFAMENHIDVLINNSGFGISGPIEENDITNFQQMLNVNIVGVFNVSVCTIKYLVRSNGIIFNIGSMAGIFSVPFQTAYSMTKKAVDLMSQSFYKELLHKDIRICNIMPGDTKTEFTKNRVKIESKNYGDTPQKAVERMEKDEQKGRDPKVIGNIILKHINRKKVPIRIAVGFEYKILLFLSKIFTAKFICWAISLIYCKK